MSSVVRNDATLRPIAIGVRDRERTPIIMGIPSLKEAWAYE